MQSAGGMIQVEGVMTVKRDAILRWADLVVHVGVGVAMIGTRQC